MIKVKCLNCGKEFETTQHILSLGRGKYCSNACRYATHGKDVSGNKSGFWKGGKVIRKCLFCDKEFKIFPCRVKKFCSVRCSSKYYGSKQKSKRIKKLCEICGKEFYVIKSRKDSEYCSRRCKHIGQTKHINKICKICGKHFTIHPSDIRKSPHAGTSCSKKCNGIAFGIKQTGKNNHMWRGGVTSEIKKIRDSKEMREWRTKVFERDKYICQRCGNKSGKRVPLFLNAHHIKSFKDYPELRFDVNNGMTYCKYCHYSIHRKIGVKMKKKITERIKRFEGLRLFPYFCSQNFNTIGYGRNLDTVGISKKEAEYLLKNDLVKCIESLKKNIPFYLDLPENVQVVLIDLCFNMGIYGLLGFKKMLQAISEGDYKQASVELKDSKYFKQVPYRAEQNMKLMQESNNDK